MASGTGRNANFYGMDTARIAAVDRDSDFLLSTGLGADSIIDRLQISTAVGAEIRFRLCSAIWAEVTGNLGHLVCWLGTQFQRNYTATVGTCAITVRLQLRIAIGADANAVNFRGSLLYGIQLLFESRDDLGHTVDYPSLLSAADTKAGSKCIQFLLCGDNVL